MSHSAEPNAPSTEPGAPSDAAGSPTDRATLRHERRVALGVFVLLFASYAYFYQGGGWNENSRMDLVRAVLDDHSLSIDRYHENTGDKALVGGRYYSDKAPGMALAATPAYAAVRLLRPAFSDEHSYWVVSSYLVTLLSAGIAGALAGALLYRATRKLGASRMGSIVGAIGYGLGTPAFAFSTMLFSHQLAAVLLFGSFMLLWRCRERYSDRLSVLAGLLGAAAVLTEFPTLPAVAILGAYHASHERRVRRSLTFAAGALLPLLMLALYLAVVFGSPFNVGYGFLADPASRAEMRERGIFGMTWPSLQIFVEVLIGRYRGLLPYSPVLLLAAVGFPVAYGILRQQSQAAADRAQGRAPSAGAADAPLLDPLRTRELAAAAAVVGYFVIFVASYSWWQGGSSFGSRHLLPMLPFLALPFGLVFDLRPKISVSALVLSVTVMVIVASVQPKPGDHLKNPFWGAIFPAFLRGQIAASNICPMTGRPTAEGHPRVVRTASSDAFNLGMLLGGRGKKSLAPLIALWVAAAYAFWRHAEGEDPAEPVDDAASENERLSAG